MKYINIIAEGKSEEAFVNDVLVKHFAAMIFLPQSAQRFSQSAQRVVVHPPAFLCG